MKIKLQKSIKEKELDQYYQNQYAALADQHCRTFNISGNNSALKSSNSVSYNSSSSRVSHLDSMTMSRNLRKMSTIGNKSIFSDFNKKHRSYTIHSHQNRSLQSSKNPSRNLSRQSADQDSNMSSTNDLTNTINYLSNMVGASSKQNIRQQKSNASSTASSINRRQNIKHKAKSLINHTHNLGASDNNLNVISSSDRKSLKRQFSGASNASSQGVNNKNDLPNNNATQQAQNNNLLSINSPSLTRRSLNRSEFVPNVQSSLIQTPCSLPNKPNADDEQNVQNLLEKDRNNSNSSHSHSHSKRDSSHSKSFSRESSRDGSYSNDNLPSLPNLQNFNRSRRGSALSAQILFLRLQDRRRSSNPMIEHLIGNFSEASEINSAQETDFSGQASEDKSDISENDTNEMSEKANRKNVIDENWFGDWNFK